MRHVVLLELIHDAAAFRAPIMPIQKSMDFASLMGMFLSLLSREFLP